MKLGLLGEKLSHSYSPQIHKLALEVLKLEGTYVLFERKKEDISSLVLEIREERLDGFNITIPYKIEVMKYLDRIGNEAEKIGACNTVVRENGELVGYNTDYFGLLATIEKMGADLKGKKAVILGSGGASLAAVEVLLQMGAEKVYMFKRPEDEYSGREVEKLEFLTYDKLSKIYDADIIINCTPVGMYPNIGNTLVEKSIFLNYTYAVDLIYNPKKTLFLKEAEEQGLKISNGLYMLVLQALKSEELWTGKSFSSEEVEYIYGEIEKLVYKE
jgi:shikimate dehydrogenase